jgi:hypothetical protein
MTNEFKNMTAEEIADVIDALPNASGIFDALEA